jgi:hypothetical protein
MSVRGERVYLSGPMEGVENLNREGFREAERALYAMGAAFVFNPCERWRLPNGQLPNLPREEFMRRDLNLLTTKTEREGGGFSLIALLDGWGTSRGAKVELSVARAIGIAALTMEELLRGDKPTWRKTCSMCGAYYAPYCYGIELMAGSDRELEHPYKTEPDDWCPHWRRERKTEWNGKPCGRKVI